MTTWLKEWTTIHQWKEGTAEEGRSRDELFRSVFLGLNDTIGYAGMGYTGASKGRIKVLWWTVRDMGPVQPERWEGSGGRDGTEYGCVYDFTSGVENSTSRGKTQRSNLKRRNLFGMKYRERGFIERDGTE